MEKIKQGKEATGSRRVLLKEPAEVSGGKMDGPTKRDHPSCRIFIPLSHNLIRRIAHVFVLGGSMCLQRK